MRGADWLLLVVVLVMAMGLWVVYLGWEREILEPKVPSCPSLGCGSGGCCHASQLELLSC